MMVGQTLGHYRILNKLGEGGMGEVYRAEDLNLKRQVALKILSPEMATNRERLERFRREARALAALEHPNIVNVHSVETVDGLHFLTMELIEGETLAETIPRHGMSLRQLFSTAVPMADALSKAHERGIVHRDFKPTNVMLTSDGVVKVLDFGLAKIESVDKNRLDTQAATEVLTGEGRILGTPSYMSPEQLKGEPVDHRSDIFSLGIVLYQAATGHRPFTGKSSIEVHSSILRDMPPPVDKVRRDVPHHLARIINGCLEKDPEDRYQSAKDVRNELAWLRTELTSGEVAVPDRPELAPVESDRPKWAWAGGAAAIIVVLLLYWSSDRPGKEIDSDPAEPPPILTVMPEAQLLLDQGYRFELEGDTKENLEHAEDRYRRALQLEPNNPLVQGRLAMLLARAYLSYPSEERAAEIRHLAQAALDEAPDLPEATGALGQLALIEGHADTAAKIGRQLISTAPDDYRGYTLSGEALVVSGQTDEGLKLLRQAADMAGPDVRARLTLASKLHQIGRDNEAAAEYETVLNFHPRSPNALNNLAMIYGREGRYLEAIPYLKMLAELHDEAAAMNLGNCYLFLGRLDEAIGAYEQTIELAPERPLAYQGLAEAYEMQGNPTVARQWYEEAITRFDAQIDQGGGPRSKFFGSRAVCHAKLDHRDQAISDIDEALTLAPERGEGLFNAAQVYAVLGERKQAYKYMERAIVSGYGREEFDNNIAFAALRGEPEFLALIEAPATR
ncbi:MAG: protein kinase [Acidobacteriota bacterium]